MKKIIQQDQLPPSAPDLEACVLGAILLEKDAFFEAADVVKPYFFYEPKNQIIATALWEMKDKGKAIDLPSITDYLRKKGQLEQCGGAYYVTTLADKVAASAHIAYHCHVIAEKFMARQLKKLGYTLSNINDQHDIFEEIDKAQSQLFDVSGVFEKSKPKEITGIISKSIKNIEEIEKTGVAGILSGFKELDEKLYGFKGGELTILAARPGMGKTSFALQLAVNASKNGSKSMFFSLEMNDLRLGNRILSLESNIPLWRLNNAKLQKEDYNRIQNAVTKIDELPLWIDDSFSINPFEIRTKARKLANQHGLDLIVIDYIQLINPGISKGNREQEVSYISRSLKMLSKELNVPVIALSQLSRAVETRGGSKRPQLSDLRESGAIEQDADVVSFIYRPEYYGITEDENGDSLNGYAEFIIAKNRNGGLGNVALKFDGDYTRFSNYTTESYDSKPF